MATRVLALSRETKLFPYWELFFKRLGYGEIRFSSRDRDGLNSVIDEYKPGLLIMGSGFYKTSTPFMVGRLLDVFPKLNIAAVNIHECPDDLAMFFVVNGAKSYVNIKDGMEEFERALAIVRDGGAYVSKGVAERLALRKELPRQNKTITDRQREVMRLICCGFRDAEIADTLQIAKSTVDTHKAELFTALNVRNACELMKRNLQLGNVSLDELDSYPNNYTLNPRPAKKAG